MMLLMMKTVERASEAAGRASEAAERASKLVGREVGGSWKALGDGKNRENKMPNPYYFRCSRISCHFGSDGSATP